MLCLVLFQMTVDSDLLCSEIHCLSNEIKDLIPKLITRIEYNKLKASSISNSSQEELFQIKKQTSTFLKELESLTVIR